MTKDEARTLLVEQGALLIVATIKAVQATEKYEAAIKECRDAAMPIYEHNETLAQLPADEQHECYLESCLLANVDPDAPELACYRAAFRAVKDLVHEDRLLTQLNNAPLN